MAVENIPEVLEPKFLVDRIEFDWPMAKNDQLIHISSRYDAAINVGILRDRSIYTMDSNLGKNIFINTSSKILF